MNDLISRQGAIDELTKVYNDCVPDAFEELDIAVTTLRELPSAEPERKTGKWIYDTERVWHDGGIYIQYHCSECKFQIIGSLYNYCPNCGAEMRGGNE